MVSRRKFIGNVAAGAGVAGLSLMVSKRDRALAFQTESHIEDFVSHVRGFRMSPEATSNFQAVAEQVIQVINADSRSRATFDAVLAWIANPLIPIPPGQPLTDFGVPEDVSRVIGAAYLRSQSALEETTRALNPEYIRDATADPAIFFNKIEPDFARQLSERLKVETTSDPELDSKIQKATSELLVTGPKISQPVPSGGMSKAASTVTCRINGQVVPCWQAVAVTVIVIIIVIALK
jgi:hypothetical protein